MLPIITMLASKGLELVANAVLAKGKDVIEKQVGVKLQPDMSEDSLLKLKQYQLENERELMQMRIEEDKLTTELAKVISDAEQNENNNVSTRWVSDMNSDSWLSKNIRPMALIAIFVAYLLFAGLSAAGINITESYVTLLGQWGQIIMTAYFGGRSAEKIVELVQRRKAAAGDAQ